MAEYIGIDHTIDRKSRLHRLVSRMLDTYIDDLTDERIEEVERLIDTYRITHASGVHLRDHAEIASSTREIIAGLTEDWRRIETAPKDGTKVLVGRFVPGDEFDGRVRVDWWHSHMRHGFTGFGHFNPIYWPPTHWMPLPKRPTT